MCDNPCASVTSEPNPQHGQKHRSSGNFSTEGCSGDKIQFSSPEGVVYDIMEDKSLAPDPTIYKDVTNGTIVEKVSSRSLYVANPKHASGNFVVFICPA